MIIRRLTLLTLLSLIKLSILYTQVISIDGQVLRHNGDPLSNVMVTCSNGDASITDKNGSFNFSDLPVAQNYEIDGFYEKTIFEEVSVLDACYNRFIVNQIYNALNSQFLANDFNQDGMYQGLDFIRITNAAIKIENNLNELNSPWRFFDSYIDSINVNTNDIESGMSLKNITSDTSGLVLVAVKSGDVAIDGDHLPPPSDAPHPVFYFSDMTINQNQEILVSVKVRDMNKIMGFQHCLTWDTSFLNFIAYENKVKNFDLIPNEENLDEGLFPLMEIDVSALSGAQSLADNSSIYEVRFKALKESNSLEGILGFDSSFLQKQVIYLDDGNFTLHLLESEYIIEESVSTLVNPDPSNILSFDIMPNPVITALRYSFQFEKPETSILSLLDIHGKLLHEQIFNSQSITGEISMENLSAAVYFLQLQTKEGITSTKFIKF